MTKYERCEECDCSFKEDTNDYDSVYQTGYCDECLMEKYENGEEW